METTIYQWLEAGANDTKKSTRMAVNVMVQQLCREDEVGFVDLRDSFVGKEEMYMRDGLHLSRKGAAVFAEGLPGRLPVGWVKYDI